MVISVQNLSKTFQKNLRRLQALRAVSFTIPERSIVGILGPNGAGKTTLFKILTGIIRADSGSVSIWGETELERVKPRIGFLPENPEFFRNISAGELLSLSLTLAGHAVNDQKIAQTLRLVDLEGERREKIKTFSKGMMQRIGIAQAIIHDPELLILDEPMSGLDPLGRRLVSDLIQRFFAAGKTVLFSSHDLDDIESLCHEVIILHHGEIRLQSRLADLQQHGSYQITSERDGQSHIYDAANADALWQELQGCHDRNEQLRRVQSGITKTLESYFEAKN